MWHRPIPYSSFLTLRSTGGMAPPPCGTLIYASEQHATAKDLQKKAREKSNACASCRIVRPEAARSTVLGELGARWRLPPTRDRGNYDLNICLMF